MRTQKYFQKNLKLIFVHKNFKKTGPQKLLIIVPNPYLSQSIPDHSPQPRIDFSYYEISEQDICSLICANDPIIENIAVPNVTDNVLKSAYAGMVLRQVASHAFRRNCQDVIFLQRKLSLNIDRLVSKKNIKL